MVRKLALFLGLVGLLSAQPSFSKVGIVGATFLKIPVGARPLGVGEAVTALSGDLFLLPYNPAAISDLSRPTAVFNHARWLLDVTYNYGAGAYPLGLGVFAAQVGVMGYGELEETTLEEPEGTGQTFTAGSSFLGLSYGAKLTDRFSFGLTFKVVREAIWDVSGTALAFDIGAIYNTGFRNIRIGFAMANYGTKIELRGRNLNMALDIEEWRERYGYKGILLPVELTSTPYDLPLRIRLGVASDFQAGARGILTASADLVHPNDGQEKVDLGLEYRYAKTFALRLGYRYDPDRFWDRPNMLENFAGGAGFRLPLGMGSNIEVNYAFLNDGRLGVHHYFSVSYAF